MPSADPRWPPSIQAINALPDAEKRKIYRELIPDWIFDRYGIDRQMDTVAGRSVLSLRAPSGARGMELSVRHHPDARDPVLYINLADSALNQLLALLLVVNDPEAPRFDTDVLSDGTPTNFGTTVRNIPAEIAAMAHGLAPGQIRAGLRAFGREVPRFERFVQKMGHPIFLIEPLTYHNAITFERYGFSYIRGRAAMEAIHAGFQPGGEYDRLLDGATPFRASGAGQTVRGRSWAIHDGILGRRFDGFQMLRRIGHDAQIQTFPDAVW